MPTERTTICPWCKAEMPDNPGAYYHESACHRRDVLRRIEEAEREGAGADTYQKLARLERELEAASYVGD